MAEAECLDPSLPQTRAASRLVSWGVTPRTVELAGKLGLEQSFPSVEIVREINDKRFSHKLAQELDIALPYSEIAVSTGGLKKAIRSCPYDWVLKHPFGVSARERVLGKAGEISPSALGWAEKQFEQQWGLVFEPWVERAQEFSIHFEIEPSTQVRYLGQCELVTDQGGVYRGNRVLPGIQDDEAAARALEAAQELARRGYWGPVGIDAFRGKLGTQNILRPLVEINARYSFGRLTLALAEMIPKQWCCFWWHPKGSSSNLHLPQLEPGEAKAGAFRLASLADPEQVSSTLVFLAPTSSKLDDVVSEHKPALT